METSELSPREKNKEIIEISIGIREQELNRDKGKTASITTLKRFDKINKIDKAYIERPNKQTKNLCTHRRFKLPKSRMKGPCSTYKANKKEFRF